MSGDPAKILEWEESRALRNRYGCFVCTSLEWSEHGCKIKRRPGPRGFCPSWDLDVNAEPLRIVG